MSEWQPMKTAPKDWTHVLIYDRSSRTVGEAYYRTDEDDHGWYWANLGPLDESAVISKPAKWMPLPEPPQ